VATPSSAPPTTQQHALDLLRQMVVSGELMPGQRVNQEDVAGRIGVSIAPVREALRVLEQEGQLTYLPRRGYFVTELRVTDLEEIYDLRRMIEGRAAREGLAVLDADGLDRIRVAARACVDAAETGDVAAELAANRAFHYGMFDSRGRPHTLRLIQSLWDATEAYRAIYYNSPDERRASIDAHDRILAALEARDADRLVAELDAHRERALIFLRQVFAVREGSAPPSAGATVK
jgi:DNA-binding GntR family transcriptional regulator